MGSEFRPAPAPAMPKNAVINLDHGDPTIFESYWKMVGERAELVVSAVQTMSYFSDPTGLCWFMEPRFAEEVRRVHRLVWNANADGKYVVVGNGSSQVFQASLYALSLPETSRTTDIVSAAPYYSSYTTITNLLQSKLYRWAGDAREYVAGDAPCVEVVCSPNNPDGLMNKAVVKSEGVKTIYDLAYYWPQYTAISSTQDHDIMLFTFSKCTGHAGTRLGWALVKDSEVAKRMTKFIELNTIGVSKDSQLRAAKLLSFISDELENGPSRGDLHFFQYGRLAMAERWRRLREVVQKTGAFSLLDYPSEYCHFSKQPLQTTPAFAWIKCEKEGVEDCHSLLKSHNILVRAGAKFGMGTVYVRASMVDRDPPFELFLERISAIGKNI